MTNLTKIINQNYITEDIDRHYESVNVQRTHLGLSECGHPCQRFLWYVHNGYPRKSIGGRILRLFQLGNILEEQIRKDFMAAGFGMHSDQKEIFFEHTDPVTGQKYKLTGHCDGIVTGLQESDKPYLWECKTAGEKAFKQLLKCNSYEAWNIKYKAQIHAYMLGLKLDRALITVYNKNTSEMYQERIRLDRNYAVDLLQKVLKTIALADPPERLCPRGNWWEANFCPYQKTCWNIN